MDSLKEIWREAWQPPDRRPAWQWCEDHIEGIPYSPNPGRFRSENSPWIREVMEALFMMGNEFYLTHRYDKRGRCYAQGYHVTTQGNPWNKAVIEFAHEELATGAIATPNQERKAA